MGIWKQANLQSVGIHCYAKTIETKIGRGDTVEHNRIRERDFNLK